jgi:hypothetical protein
MGVTSLWQKERGVRLQGSRDLDCSKHWAPFGFLPAAFVSSTRR